MTRLAQIAAPFGAALALALAASTAHAGEAAPARDLTMNVSVADLNADRPGDAAKLQGRLHAAAVRLCLQATEELADAEAQTAFSRCVATATGAALHDAALVLPRGPLSAATTVASR